MTKTVFKISRHIPSALQQRMDFSGGRTFSLSIEHPVEPILRRFAVVAIFMLAFGYLYFVSDSVLNVIARKEALTGIAAVQTSMSVIEGQYFALSQGLKPSMGAQLGLSPVQDTSYVSRAGNTALANGTGAVQGDTI